MNSAPDINIRAEALRAQFHKKLGVKARTLEQALRKTGRRLPRNIRTQAAFIVDAVELQSNPKLARRLDPAAMEAAYVAVSKYLSAIDTAQIRRDMIIRWLALIAAQLLMVVAALVVWLWWRGYV